MLLYGNLFTLRGELDNSLFVISKADSTSVTFVLSADYDDFFSNEIIFNHAVLVRNCTTRSWFHEFITQNYYISTIFNEYAILLDKIFVPQEKIVLESVFNWGD